MAEFGKLNFAVAFNPQTAFPLDARYYFDSLSAAQDAAAGAVEAGSSEGTHFFGETVCVVADGAADLYIIQPDKTLKTVGSAVLGDGKSIEIVDGKVTIKGFGEASAGQQPRISADGTSIEWYTPDTSTVSGLADTVAGHTQDIANLQNNKADKATTLAGYGITDAMTATAITAAIQSAIAETGHASFVKVDAVPDAESAEENVLYLVYNSSTSHYDIYALVGETVELLDDTSVDLSNYVQKESGKGLSTNDFTDDEKSKLAGIAAGAEVNAISGVSSELSISEDDKILSILAVSQDKVTGLTDALANKVDVVAGKGLSTNDFTSELKSKLENLNADGEANVLEAVKINGAALQVTDKAVDIPIATAAALGVVKGSTADNSVTVASDGSMSVNSLNVNKLIQDEGELLILDGGNAAI